MSLWWFLPPLVLLAGTVLAVLQARSIHHEAQRLRSASRRLGAFQPALVRVRSDIDELRARLREDPRR